MASSVAWVPDVPPTRGVRVEITHPTEAEADGVVRYRIHCVFDPRDTAYDAPPSLGPSAPPMAEILHRLTHLCNDAIVIRRFSEFDTVFKAIAATKPDPPLPPLPEKRIFGNKDPKFVEERRKALEAFTNEVVRRHALSCRPDFLHLMGFSSVQLWFALAAGDDEAPPDAVLESVLKTDTEALRGDLILRSATTKEDGVRRSIGRLLYYALHRGDATASVFVYEKVRVVLTSIASKAEHDVTMVWISRAIVAFATTLGDVGVGVVGRGDVRDALVRMASAAKSEAARVEVLAAMHAIITGSNIGAMQLYVTVASRDALANACADVYDTACVGRCVQCLDVLTRALPQISHVSQKLFHVDNVYTGLASARDRVPVSRDLAIVVMERAGGAADTPAPPAPSPPAPMAAAPRGATGATAVAAVPAKSSSNTAVDDFLDDDDDEPAPSPSKPAAAAAPADEELGAGAVDDFLDDDDDAAPAPTATTKHAAEPPSSSAVDDFLDD